MTKVTIEIELVDHPEFSQSAHSNQLAGIFEKLMYQFRTNHELGRGLFDYGYCGGEFDESLQFTIEGERRLGGPSSSSGN